MFNYCLPFFNHIFNYHLLIIHDFLSFIPQSLSLSTYSLLFVIYYLILFYFSIHALFSVRFRRFVLSSNSILRFYEELSDTTNICHDILKSWKKMDFNSCFLFLFYLFINSLIYWFILFVFHFRYFVSRCTSFSIFFFFIFFFYLSFFPFFYPLFLFLSNFSSLPISFVFFLSFSFTLLFSFRKRSSFELFMKGFKLLHSQN